MLKISTRCFAQLFIFILLLNTASLSLAAESSSAAKSLPESYLTGNTHVKATLFEFSAPWCIDCQLIKPAVKKLTQEAGKDLDFVEFNIDDPKNAPMIKRYKVIVTPTFIIFNAKGQVVKRFGDTVTAQQLRDKVLQVIEKRVKN